MWINRNSGIRVILTYPVPINSYAPRSKCLSFLLINSFQFLKILYINIYIHTHIHTYTYIYIHTYTHIHTHIHIHIYIYISYVIVRIKVPQCSIPILLGHIKLVFTLSSVNSNYPNTQISMLP